MDPHFNMCLFNSPFPPTDLKNSSDNKLFKTTDIYLTLNGEKNGFEISLFDDCFECSPPKGLCPEPLNEWPNALPFTELLCVSIPENGGEISLFDDCFECSPPKRFYGPETLNEWLKCLPVFKFCCQFYISFLAFGMKCFRIFCSSLLNSSKNVLAPKLFNDTTETAFNPNQKFPLRRFVVSCTRSSPGASKVPAVRMDETKLSERVQFGRYPVVNRLVIRWRFDSGLRQAINHPITEPIDNPPSP
ncbi:hypothetical protein CEXT_106391 [Caerostris extrusa]|uniref:Uncharacterized protein n=1 Tax=Caerostris extrusa TaxID=172846 RepID=A0AAV4VMG9_CAEEX|nr:hypothetical protein CEXT_106391 [Caerostris extrusa]